jgi:hypothetical protein
MKVTGIETLHCDAGWRNYGFVKLTTDESIVGWSESDEGFGLARRHDGDRSAADAAKNFNATRAIASPMIRRSPRAPISLLLRRA